MKILNNIKEYQEYPAISYSKLSMCDRAPWELNQEKLPPGPAMLFGSAVDVLLQPGNKFEEEFTVLDTVLPDKTTVLGKLINVLWVMQDWSKESVEIALVSIGAKQMKIDKALEEIEPWKIKFELLKQAKETGKKIISSQQETEAIQVTNTLFSHPWCSHYFSDEKDTETIFQLPIVFQIDEIWYKTLPDLIYIDHRKREIIPIDVKHTEKLWDFSKSWSEYRYDIQDTLHTIGSFYWASEKYPAYKVLPTEFLVCSKNSFGKILRFTTGELNHFERYNNGWTNKFGRKFRSIAQLTDDLKWYEVNGYSEKRELVELKGLVKLEI